MGGLRDENSTRQVARANIFHGDFSTEGIFDIPLNVLSV
jgi:hypothetical protein